MATPAEHPGANTAEIATAIDTPARLSRQLVGLRLDLPVTVDWEAARVGHWQPETLQELFREFGFRRFGDEVRALAGGAAPPAAPPQKGGRPARATRPGELFAKVSDAQAAGAPPAPATDTFEGGAVAAATR